MYSRSNKELVTMDASTKKKKLKTKATNSYGHFLRIRKEWLTETDPEAKIDLKEILQEWRGMGADAKQYFVNLYEKEKEELASNPTEGRVVKSNYSKKKKKKEINVKNLEVKENTTGKFLTKLEIMDERIGEVRAENQAYLRRLSDQKEHLAVDKFKLKVVAEELEALKEKYDHLVNQHDKCQ